MEQQEQPGCLGFLFRLFGVVPSKGGGTAGPLPYRRKDWLFSKAERAFFDALQQAVGGEWLIFAKIRTGDLLWLPKGTEQRQGHWNRIQSKHIDFVVCDRANIRPLLAIELDDSSHERADRKDRDVFLNAAFQAAGLPLLRVPCKAGYNVGELAAHIRNAMKSANQGA